MQIENKVFLVTGGASGLGAATAQMLVAAGAKVMLVDMNAKAVAAQAERLGAQSTVADISNESQAEAAVQATVNVSGYLNGLVNCAGIGGKIIDGLEDDYEKGRLMGAFAEDCAGTDGFSCKAQGAFSIASTTRAQQAIKDGSFKDEIVPLTETVGKEQVLISNDEQPQKAELDKIALLKPALREGGTVTAANSNSISDGAAALVLTRRSEAQTRGLKPLAVIHGRVAFVDTPGLFPMAAVGAINKLMKQTGWSLDQVDLVEVNDALRSSTMVTMAKLEIPHEKINVLAMRPLGYPIEASAARILVTLLSAPRQKGLRRGVAAICIGGG